MAKKKTHTKMKKSHECYDLKGTINKYFNVCTHECKVLHIVKYTMYGCSTYSRRHVCAIQLKISRSLLKNVVYLRECCTRT